MDEETESGAPLIALIILFIGAAFITVGAVFLTYGLYVLIRTGTWPDYPLGKMLGEIGIPTPHLSWQGGQRALDWLFAASACTVLLTIGGVITLVGVSLVTRHNRRRAAAAAVQDAG